MQLLLLALGSAALALWVAVRFESLGPRSAADALVRAGLACLAGVFVEPLMGFWLGLPLPRPAFFALMLGAVPVLVLMFLTGAWLLLALRGSFVEGRPSLRRRSRPRTLRPALLSLGGLTPGSAGNDRTPMTEGVVGVEPEHQQAARVEAKRADRRVALAFLATVVAAQVVWLGSIGLVVALVIH